MRAEELYDARAGIELLAPAGSPDKLRYALAYGADAVYAGLPDFSMRRRINTFTDHTLQESVDYAHQRGKKFFVTVNTYPHNTQLSQIEGHLSLVSAIGADGIILSDPGVLAIARRVLPHIPIHLSTQANAINWEAVNFWANQGVSRVVLAREVTLEEIKEIKRRVPHIEIEYFVHGAMCMSYSGRCMLSSWMTGRSANLGDCAQPCRWAYHPIKEGVEPVADEGANVLSVADDRNNIGVDIEEDCQGTYFFNSKDLNLLGHLADLRSAGVDSFKIEGRNKSVYYVSIVTRAYRRVLDAIASGVSPQALEMIIKEEQQELTALIHRGYTTGFLLGERGEQNVGDSIQPSAYQFVGQVEASHDGILKVRPHNAISRTDRLEAVEPGGNVPIVVDQMLDDRGEEAESIHGGQERFYYLRINRPDIRAFSLLRKIVNPEESQYNGNALTSNLTAGE